MTTLKPILFATDGSPSAVEAQREALDLASRLDAPFVVRGTQQAHEHAAAA